MVTEVKAFRTNGGSLFSDRESAFKAEDAESTKNFEHELKVGLGISTTEWEELQGELWACLLYTNPMLLNKLYSKYKRI